jgi:hypothetical protein
LEDLGVEGEKTLKFLLQEIIWDGVDWIYRAQDRDKCRAVVTTVINLQFHKTREVLDYLRRY